LTRAYGKWQAPEQIKSTLARIDSVTNAFKALASPIWIPSQVRNALTAGTNNVRHSVGLRDNLDQLRVVDRRGEPRPRVDPSVARRADAGAADRGA
jgi:hypothetical protein